MIPELPFRLPLQVARRNDGSTIIGIFDSDGGGVALLYAQGEQYAERLYAIVDIVNRAGDIVATGPQSDP